MVEAAFSPHAAPIMTIHTQRGLIKFAFTTVCFGLLSQATVSRCLSNIAKQQWEKEVLGGGVRASGIGCSCSLPALRNRNWVRNLLPVMFKSYVICHGILSHTSTLYSFRLLRSRLGSFEE